MSTWSDRETSTDGFGHSSAAATDDLIAAAMILADTLAIGEDAKLYETRLNAFLEVYRPWLLARRGMAGAARNWAERSSILLHCLCAGETLQESIDILIRFAGALWGELVTVSARHEDGQIAIIFDEPFLPGIDGLIKDMWLPTATLSMLEFLAGDALHDVTRRARQAECLPPKVENLLFGQSVTYSSGETALIVPARELRRAVVGRASRIADFHSDFMRATVRAIRRSSEMRLRVSTLLWNSAQANKEIPNLEALAVLLGTSPASIKRGLAQESTTFRELKNYVLDGIAKSKLRETTASLEKIAAQLGYSDGYAFRRAFKRRNGLAPSAYRRTSAN